MALTVQYGETGLSSEQLAQIQRGLALAAERMTDFQILDLAESLHGMLRTRRHRSDYHRLDLRA